MDIFPTARWAEQQIINAFPFDRAPRFLIRDRDAIYGLDFCERVKNMGIEGVVTAFRSPFALAESFRREADRLVSA